MSAAHLRVLQVGPLVTLQDAGRFGALRYGVSAAGPMDRLSFAAANACLGQHLGQTGVEISLGGLALECVSGLVSLAVTGGEFGLELGGEARAGWHVVTLEPGQRLSIRGGAWGSWAYLAFAGKLKARDWLGSAATASMTNFGGGALEPGQELIIEEAQALPARNGPVQRPHGYAPPKTVRASLGPQDRHFTPEQIEAFAQDSFTVSGAYDRMGMQLHGPRLSPDGALSIPSEPILRGSVQVSGDGTATILLADHGTTGGYPKIATVIADDQDLLAQLRSGDRFRFSIVSPDDALSIARREAQARVEYFAALARPKASLAEKLMRENLVDGVVSDTPDE
ncbi:MAG: biotin-dependent carboxyltransferase family protein [Pseudomonadota bacterium]